MTIVEKIKNDIMELKGEEIIIRQSSGRRKVKKIKGMISEIYNNLFIIKTKDKNYSKVSFSYNDILIRNVSIEIPNKLILGSLNTWRYVRSF